MAFRLLKYKVNIMAYHLSRRIKGTKPTLPIVYPIVLYNGAVQYKYSNDLFDMFAQPDLARKLLFAPFELVDVNNIADEEMLQRPWSGSMEYRLKYIREEDFLPYVLQLSKMFKAIAHEGGGDFIYHSVKGIVLTHKISNRNQLFDIITKEVTPDIGEKVMTLAEELRLEGRYEGKIEGKIEGELRNKRTVATKMLRLQMPLEIISEVTELDIEEIKQIEANVAEPQELN